MPSGYRRPFARHGARSLIALLVVITAGAAGSGQLAPSSVARPVQVAAPGPDQRPGESLTPRSRPTVTAALLAGYDAPADPSTVDPDAAAGLTPSIQYEEAVRHASDRIDFRPGDRVAVGFTPRAGDPWTIDGKAPTALPAGRLDGATIRGQGRVRDVSGRNPAADDEDVAADPTVDLPDGAGDGGQLARAASATTPVANPSVEPDARISIEGLRKEIFGFLPYWELNSSSLRLDFRKISTIAYFGVGADATGNLQKRNSDGSLTVGWSGWTSSKMTSVISQAHSTHTRVVLTVQSFGWSTAGLNRQKALLGASTRRANLARQIAAAVRDRGVDGVNLDFEPLASGYEAEFTALVRSIRAEMNKIHSGYQITFDTLGSIGNYPIESATASGAADAIFIMGYDYRTAGSSPVGSIAPLDRAGYGIRDTIVAYADRVSPSKLILGVPYYGRAWSTSSNALRATNVSGVKYGASTTVVYDTAADYLAEKGRHYDALEGVAWTAYRRQNCTSTYGCVTSWRELYVDDATAIGAKYDLVNQYRLRGAGIWALGYDGARPELWATIQRKFVTDTTPPVAGIVSLSGRQVNPSFTVTWTGRDDVAVKSYDVQVSTNGGAWTNWHLGTTAGSALWAGFDGVTYAFRVRARDPHGNVGAWNVASTTVAAPAALKAGTFATVRIDGLAIRTSASPSAPALRTLDAGDVLAVVGGPVSAGGYTWVKVTGPLTEWGPVAPTTTAWVASSGGRLGPAKAPNATKVGAAIGGLSFNGAGSASVGSSTTAARHRAFSPNGDGSGDAIAIDWTADRPFDRIVLRIFSASGARLGDVSVPGTAAGSQSFAWNGRVNGSLLADGRYLGALIGISGSSSFANPGTTFRSAALARYGITIDRLAPVVTSSSATSALISPNGDGIRDTVTVALGASGSTTWSFSAAPLNGSTVGAAVETRSGSGSSARVTWNGRTNGGAVVGDGLYRLTLAARDPAGNRASRSWTIRVDHTPAALSAAASPASISPDADGQSDSSRIAWSASERISGVVRLVHGSTVLRSWTLPSGTSGAVTWNGLDASGRRVADGTYGIQLIGRDAAGNRSARTVTVVVDRTVGTLAWSRWAFYPQDGDTIAASGRLAFTVRRSATVSVGIYHGSTLIRSIWTSRATSAGTYGWTWDGRNGAGALVPRGTYEVRVTARSWVGTSVHRRTILVDAFRTALSASTLRAGQTLTITLTAVEALKANPVVTLKQVGKAAVSRTATALGSGRYRVSFTIASGGTGTATIRITGRDTAGGANVSLGSVRVV